jgi:hypothetical protein
MNATLTRIAMAAPIVAALLALTSGWDVAEAKPGPSIDDITTNQPVVDPEPQPPKWQNVPDIDIDDVTVDPGNDDPEPPADDPAPPADNDDDSDDSDHDEDSDDDQGNSNGTTTGGTTTRPSAGKPAPAVQETDTVFNGSDARNASEDISPKFVQGTGVEKIPAGVVFGIGAALVAVIGWAAFRHHRLSL